jgi:hypothetical protein
MTSLHSAVQLMHWQKLALKAYPIPHQSVERLRSRFSNVSMISGSMNSLSAA